MKQDIGTYPWIYALVIIKDGSVLIMVVKSEIIGVGKT